MLKNNSSVHFALHLSHEQYFDGFRTYKKISTEWLAIIDWLQNKLITKIRKKDLCTILSVGSGAGDFDCQLIKIFKNHFASIEYIAVEPNDTCCQQFKILLDSFNDLYYEIHCSLFEEFSSNKSFDLIHFTHCLYYIGNRGKAILHALNMLDNDGELLIFNQTSKGINQIQQKFLKRVGGNTDYMFSSVDLEQILNHYDIPYRLDIVDSFLDVTDLCQNNTECMPNLVNFFLESEVSMLSPEIMAEVIDYIKSVSFFDKGRRFIFHPVAIFSIHKNKGRELKKLITHEAQSI